MRTAISGRAIAHFASDVRSGEFPGPDESWGIEMTEFEEDIRQKRTPDAGLKEAKAAMQIVEHIYKNGKR